MLRGLRSRLAARRRFGGLGLLRRQHLLRGSVCGVGLVQLLVVVLFFVVECVVGMQVDDVGGLRRLRTGRGFRGNRLRRGRGDLGWLLRRRCRRLLRRLGDRGHFGDGRRALGRLRKRLVGRLGQVVGLEGIALDGACLDVHFLGEAGEGGVGNDVADVEEGCLVEADVDERGLHAGEHPDYPSFIDVPDYSFLVLPLQVVLRDRPLLDQRHPGLLTRGVDHEDVGHRKILLARSRGYRATAAGRPWGAAS